MSFLSLLLRLSLIVALSLNGYASAAMIASGGHAMGPRMATAPAPAADEAMADCHDGMDMPAMAHDAAAKGHHGGAPDSAPPPGDPAAAHDGDCCGKFACQCDCLQAASIAHAIVPLPPRLDEIAPALPNAHAPPSGVLSLPIRPPIA
ncbi:CopL family metal-binding regulatory protein [Lysobacter enzymogenes]|uniref:CopL family metal-binding regulatory protein n=1 Tax=Lysobacter enzymogenes TaxID=69 RepID=UPI00374A1195